MALLLLSLRVPLIVISTLVDNISVGLLIVNMVSVLSIVKGTSAEQFS